MAKGKNKSDPLMYLVAIPEEALWKPMRERLLSLVPEKVEGPLPALGIVYRMHFKEGKESLTVVQYGGKNKNFMVQGTYHLAALGVFEIVGEVTRRIFPDRAAPDPGALMEKALSGMREGSLFDDAESAATDKASDGKISNTYPTIGVDESGKGDTFGPLVAAAVLIPDQETADALKKGGVRDSKLIGSAKEIDRIAALIFSRCGQERISIVAVNPPRYNELIREMAARKEGVNQLLGWAQARSIRELLERNLGCRKVICDQFGKREDVTRPLGALAKDLDLETTPKGERFLAVAAASIVARSRFTFLLKKLATDQGMAELPLGSSNPSIGPLIETILRDKGPTGLFQVAKVHFKNVQRYL